MQRSIHQAVLVLLLFSSVKTITTTYNIVVNGPVKIYGVQLELERENNNAELFEQFRQSICKYVLDSKYFDDPLPYQCVVEYSGQLSSYFTIKLRATELVSDPRSAYPISNSPITHMLKFHEPFRDHLEFNMITGKTLVQIYGKVARNGMDLFGFGQFYNQPVQLFLDIERQLCAAIENRRASDPIFIDTLIECLLMFEGNGYAVHMYLIFVDENVKHAGIAPEPDAIGLAVQNSLIHRDLIQGDLTYKGLLFNMTENARLTYFLLRGPILKNNRVVKFDSEENLYESNEFPDLVNQICTMVRTAPRWTALYSNSRFSCKIKAYDETNSHITILITVYETKDSPYIPVSDAVGRLQFSFTNNVFTWSAQVVNHENLTPKPKHYPPKNVELTIIKLPVTGLTIERNSKDNIVNAFGQISNHVCNSIRTQVSSFHRLKCNVLSFNPISTLATVELTMPKADLPQHFTSLGEMYLDLGFSN